MKRILLFLLPFVLSYSQKMWGQASFFDANVSKCGELERVLGEKWDKIDSLVVHGPINEDDFKIMWKCSFEGKLTVLNLEDTQIEGRKIPDCALFNYEKQDATISVHLNIRKIILPDNLEEIGKYAFMKMKLEEINFPQNLRKIGRAAFGNCHWFKTNPVIPEGVTELPARCFMNCQCFDKVTLPTSLKIISDDCFYNTRVAEVNFPEGLDSIGNGAFYASDLKIADLPNSITKIASLTFSMCDRLRYIHIPENGYIDYIPNYFAAYDDSLERVDIPNTIKKVGTCAFDSNRMLKDIKLPNGLTYIGQNAFYKCAFDSIVFPVSLEYLGGGSGAYWEHIKKIYSLAPTPPYCAEDLINRGKGPFHGYTPNDIPLYVPIGSGEKYREAFGWNYFTNIIETDKFPTGIVSPKMGKNEQCRVYGKDNELVIEIPNLLSSPIHYSIYSIEGTMIEQGNLKKSYTLKPAKGVYIVRVGNTTHKIFM
ncbi:MAG: leucine-rich repeat domain-containing protein [Prevotella pallens]|uniref:leucine-rich repeat domain-containing protein n=1 Tax=Prevotella pallens TaxID=60133 RepID=UPI001CB66A37|nr:leucine-rich repeat domain-containing protein [Prevotella pallens]MBF1490768.1 leucine-rich repeat domain-containing protein [Prevotella pallens]MBF1492997.1 leucine-rich repeat domain-containing protein [Prevotella pallens]